MVLWLTLKRYTILEDFFLSVRYRDDDMTTLKFDWYNLKILMSGWYRKLTNVYRKYISNVIPISRVMSLQYRHNIRMSIRWDQNFQFVGHRENCYVGFLACGTFGTSDKFHELSHKWNFGQENVRKVAWIWVNLLLTKTSRSVTKKTPSLVLSRLSVTWTRE